MPEMLVFVHLSDIHFPSRLSGDPYDLDEMLRRELRHDIVGQARNIGGASGLFITGDIAQAGQPVQYAKAEDWLAELCGELGIGTENVWVIPGNHDVNWDAHTPLNQALRTELEGIDLLRLDPRLEAIMRDAEAAEVLLAPLDDFTDFARKYNSHPDDEVPYWSRDFVLSEHFILRVRGMNSALISDRTDKTKKPRLVLGSVQAQLARQPGIVHLAMCHHPPDWLRDEAAIALVHSNATVFLTGHGHHSDIRFIEHCLWIAAGALHPERDQPDWEPRYNVLTLELHPGAGARASPATVEVCIYPRVWDGRRFVAGIGGSGRQCHPVELDEVAATGLVPIGSPGERYEAQPESTAVDYLADRRLRLGHRFSELLVGARNVIARSMGFGLGEIQRTANLADAVISRAEESGRLAELWDLVEAGHHQRVADNPYREGRNDE